MIASLCRCRGINVRAVTIFEREISLSRWRAIGGIGDSNAGVVSGPEDIAEAKIARWLREGGADNLRGDAYQPDRHKDAATALGKGLDYTHSKILADNNFLPQSVELRKDLDTQWEALKMEIRERFSAAGRPNLHEFLRSCEREYGFRQKIESLDELAKKVNESIISDSLRFNGMSPVQHAKPFIFETRIKEALE